MEDFTTRTYGTSGLDNRPLFGETSAKVSADPDSRVVGLCVCVSALPPRVLVAAPESTCGYKELVLLSCFLLKMFALPLGSFLGIGLARSSESRAGAGVGWGG